MNSSVMSPKTQHLFAMNDPSKGCRERWGCAGVEEGKEELPQRPRGQDLTLFHNLAVLLTSRSADAHVEEHISRNDNYKKEIKKKEQMFLAGVCFIALHLAYQACTRHF